MNKLSILILAVFLASGAACFGGASPEPVTANLMERDYGPLVIPVGVAEMAGWNEAEANELWESCGEEDRGRARSALRLHPAAGRWGDSWLWAEGRSLPCHRALIKLLGADEIGATLAVLGPEDEKVYGYRVEWKQPSGCVVSVVGRNCKGGSR